MNFERKINEVVDIIRDARDAKGCVLLIGAGCSVTADIPAAHGVIEEISKKYPHIYDSTHDKSYAGCMQRLAPGQRKALIASLIANSKINWCHMAIAQLIAEGYVTRVLTTNFDPLVARACAMVNEFPAIYDFANPPERFDSSYVHDKAIFHLHGQYTGFVLRNTHDELKGHAERLSDLFRDSLDGRPIVVVGYSGENDPVFECLAGIGDFTHTLHWVCYKDNPPPKYVVERLSGDGKYAFYIQGYDADSFFVTLAKELGCFPPRLVPKPFSYLKEVLLRLAPYVPPNQQEPMPILVDTLAMLDKAINAHESRAAGEDVAISQLWAALMAGKHEQVFALHPDLAKPVPEVLKDVLSAAYLDLGVNLSEQAETKSGEEAEALYRQACEKYEACLRIKPDLHEVLDYWGTALYGQAKATAGEKSDALYRQAYKKFEGALQNAPDKYESLYNWGTTLSAHAKTKTGEEADALYREACEKYEAALRFKPAQHEALCNWGNALYMQADLRTGEEADALYREACDKYEAARRLKPDQHQPLYNWGNALYAQAKVRTGEEANALYRQAYEKYEAALRIKPDQHEILYNWGTVLCSQADHSTGEEAAALYPQACEKYEAALQIQPDMHDVMNNWASALCAQAKIKTGEQADALYRQACEKYQAASKLDPTNPGILNNWGLTLLLWANSAIGEQADRLYSEARKPLLQAEAFSLGSGAYNLACIASRQNKPDECRKWLEVFLMHEKTLWGWAEHMKQDADLDNVRELGWFQELMQSLEKRASV